MQAAIISTITGIFQSLWTIVLVAPKEVTISVFAAFSVMLIISWFTKPTRSNVEDDNVQITDAKSLTSALSSLNRRITSLENKISNEITYKSNEMKKAVLSIKGDCEDHSETLGVLCTSIADVKRTLSDYLPKMQTHLEDLSFENPCDDDVDEATSIRDICPTIYDALDNMTIRQISSRTPKKDYLHGTQPTNKLEWIHSFVLSLIRRSDEKGYDRRNISVFLELPSAVTGQIQENKAAVKAEYSSCFDAYFQDA